MHINLSTPLSDDKEMQRRNEVILAAIEQYTEERMDDAYGRIHTDGSRSGGQPTQSDVLKAARDAINGLLDIASDDNLDSAQAGRAYAALHDIGTALKGASK